MSLVSEVNNEGGFTHVDPVEALGDLVPPCDDGADHIGSPCLKCGFPDSDYSPEVLKLMDDWLIHGKSDE